MNKKTLANILLIALLVFTVLPTLANAAGVEIIPDCDPSALPNGQTPGGKTPCGLSNFAQLLRNIIIWSKWIIIPIAFCMIGYAGLIILTSGGNAEKISKGHGMIKIAITGLIILLISYLIIQFIFNALDVTEGLGGVN